MVSEKLTRNVRAALGVTYLVLALLLASCGRTSAQDILIPIQGAAFTDDRYVGTYFYIIDPTDSEGKRPLLCTAEHVAISFNRSMAEGSDLYLTNVENGHELNFKTGFPLLKYIVYEENTSTYRDIVKDIPPQQAHFEPTQKELPVRPYDKTYCTTTDGVELPTVKETIPHLSDKELQVGDILTTWVNGTRNVQVTRCVNYDIEGRRGYVCDTHYLGNDGFRFDSGNSGLPFYDDTHRLSAMASLGDSRNGEVSVSPVDY